MKAGYTVVLAGRRKDKLDEVAQEGASGQSLAVATDVADPGLDQGAVRQDEGDTYGRLDLLFNNAGIGAPAMPIEDLPLEKWKAVVDTNLTGPFLCTQEAFRMMKAQTPRGGRIINNGSISAHTPRPIAAAYTVDQARRSPGSPSRPRSTAAPSTSAAARSTSAMPRPHSPTAWCRAPACMQPDGRMMQEARMDAADVGNAVVYMAGLPLYTNVLFMTVMANQMPFVGRG